MSKRLIDKADLVSGVLPLAQLPIKAGAGITIANDGTLATSILPAPTSTDGLPEGTTNLFHTNNRAINSTLTGYAPAGDISLTIVATDTIEAAIGKLDTITKNPKAAAAMSYSYAALTNLATNNGLVPGAWYVLSDYQTTQTVYNSSPSTTNTGPTESLLLTALSTSKFAPMGYSLTYPNDIVWYTTSNSDPRLPGITKGLVYRRHDTLLDNDIGFDFRAVKFRRWLNTTTNLYTETTSNSNGFNDYLLFSPTYYASGNVFSNKLSMFQAGSPLTNFFDVVCLDSASLFSQNVVEGYGRLTGVTVAPSGSFSGNIIQGVVSGCVVRGSVRYNIVGPQANCTNVTWGSTTTFQSNVLLGSSSVTSTTLDMQAVMTGNTLINSGITSFTLTAFRAAFTGNTFNSS